MTKKFAGRTVVVTGGAAGLGRAHALAFAKEGAHLVLLDINVDGLEETQKLVAESGSTAEIHRVDMSSEKEIQGFGKHALERHERIDVLINNAGLHMGEIARGFSDLSLEKWQFFFTVNSISPVLLAGALRPALAKAKGLIINKSSMASYNPATAYGITKATLNIFTHAMAMQFGSDDIRCVGIAPGVMATEAALKGVDADNWKRLTSMQMVSRQGTAEDIANMAVFLASDEGSFINNEVILVDGGNTMRGWRM